MPAAAQLRRSAEPEPQLEFDWLLGDRQFWTFKAAGGLLDLSDSFLEKLWDDHQHALHISGHEYNAGRGARMTKRISRAFLVRLLTKSARYSADEKRDAVLSCLRELGRDELLAISAAALRLAAGEPLSSCPQDSGKR